VCESTNRRRKKLNGTTRLRSTGYIVVPIEDVLLMNALDYLFSFHSQTLSYKIIVQQFVLQH
jgi:hypothetical protein